MWIEEISLENIKCFKQTAISFKKNKARAGWVTLLSENGGGKTTILQSIALMLAGPEVASQLLPRPIGWVQDERKVGRISCRLHQDRGDSGKFGVEKVRNAFGYSMHVTGAGRVSIGTKSHFQPGLHESPGKALSWLRENAFSSQSSGWFAAGYGAFRRLSRQSQAIVPTLQTPSRFTNFSTQFIEDEGLAAFENWLIYQDYRSAKRSKLADKNLFDMCIETVNALLPSGAKFDSIDDDGRILFVVGGKKVPTISMSDGYRSVLALAGDLIWRLIGSFPDLKEPFKAPGIVLIDELDIHLHPVWQRDIAGWLRARFPNIQFIVSTHSPMVAAGAGEDALTLRLNNIGAGPASVEHGLFAMDVETVLKSDAFGLVSTFTPEMQTKIAAFSALQEKGAKLTKNEASKFAVLKEYISDRNPYAIESLPSDMERKVAAFLKRKIAS